VQAACRRGRRVRRRPQALVDPAAAGADAERVRAAVCARPKQLRLRRHQVQAEGASCSRWCSAWPTRRRAGAFAAPAPRRRHRVRRELGNLPPNHATPTLLAGAAQALGALPRIQCEVLGPKEVAKLGMGSFAAVAQGSSEPLRFIVLRYQGAAKDQAPVVLVGKGITFDTGGVSMKPAAEMDEMKFDMCGAASVLGVFRALGELKPAINVVGLIPAAENMNDGKALKPGDVVTQHERPDHRGAQHRRRGPPHPLRRVDLRQALRTARRDRHRHAHRRLRGGAGRLCAAACSPPTTAAPSTAGAGDARSTRAGACRWTTNTPKG
jgi:hypothetical protein